MSVTYKSNEIILSPSEQKFNVDVVYARPEDIIKLDFALDNVKITFVNGDVDIIFPNGSVISLASYGTLAFDSNAPKIYDVNGNFITLEALLHKVQVIKPEDSILILANRDKYQLVQNQDQVDKIIMATEQTGAEDASGVPIAAVGETPVKTKGVLSNLIYPTGTSYNYNLNKGMGDYLANNYSSFLRGNTDTDNILPGNTIREQQPKLISNFLFGDLGFRGANRTINGKVADYYGIQFGIGENKNTDIQLQPIDMNDLGGEHQNKIFDAHSIDGKIKKLLLLDYSGGIFPQSITISGIPKDVDPSGQKLFDLIIMSGGSTKINYDSTRNVYYLTQLDPIGKIKLQFLFQDTVPDQNVVIKYMVLYFDPKTAAQKVMEVAQDVGIRTVSQKGDLNLNSVVINKGAAGLIVNAENAGTGDKIFIGGNVKNEFSSRMGNSLVFLGSGNDTIKLESGNNLIYGAIGYNEVIGSGNDGINWLVFSNEKEYNKIRYFNSSSSKDDNTPFMQSDVIKDNYYNTLKSGISLQFYLGVPKGDVLALWDKIGLTGDPGELKDRYTSNFVRAFSSLTVIGDKDGSISITNIVGSQELDTFNLYFQDDSPAQKVNLYSGEKQKIYSSQTNRVILHTVKGKDILLNFGGKNQDAYNNYMSTINGGGSTYQVQTWWFDNFTAKGDGAFIVQLEYGKVKNSTLSTVKAYRGTSAFFIGGDGINKADFSNIAFSDSGGYIVFNADSKSSNVTYFGVTNKLIDHFQNFNYIIGSKGNDIFQGSTNSKKYFFDGYEGNNTLTYERSLGGVTFDAAEQKIYKVNSKNIEDYNKYKDTADVFTNITKLMLSSLDNVILGSGDYNIGKEYKLYLGNSNNTLRYDYDTNLTSIEVDADKLIVKKNSDDNRLDKFEKDQFYGTIEYIGAKEKNLFYGGIKYSNIFNGGKATNNTLSYERLTDNKNIIIVDLFKGTVFKTGRTDVYINIQNIVGGSGNDVFTLGNMDPTNKSHLSKLDNLIIDGGGGDNVFRCNGVDISNLSKDKYALEFNVNDNKIVFYDKNNTPITLNIDLSKNITTIYGTLANNKFIASQTQDFTFDGSWIKNKYDPSKESGAPANALDYSTFQKDLIIDFSKRVVIKGEGKQDSFRNIQYFITGSGNDTFLARYSLEEKLMIFDGYKGENTLEYQNTNISMTFDFSQGTIVFGQQATDVKHYFMNIATFFGGGGENTFKLYDSSLPFLSEIGANGVNIKIGSKIDSSRTVIDFDYWGEAIGTKEKPFEVVAGKGTASNGKEGNDSITYTWDKAEGFIGSKKGSYFIIVDKDDSKASEVSFKLDGNKDSKDSVLDYSRLNVDGLLLDLNISEGVILKYSKNNMSRDIVSNFKTIILSNSDDIVKLSDVIKDNLKGLELVDGMGGVNTLDFSLLNKDVDIEITKNGLSLSQLDNLKITFINFSKMYATRGNTIFRVNDNSRGANVEISGSVNLSNNKYTTLDFTAIKDIEFWNWVSEDKPDSSDIGKLFWGGNKDIPTYIKTHNISQVKIGDGKNVIYGSLYNHTHYIGSNGEGTFNKIDYSSITKDSITVTINGVKQSAWFNHLGTKDDFTNFNYFLTTEGNDTFNIASLENLNSVILDGNKGENTLSFSNLKKDIELDISTEELNIEKSTLKIINIQHLILSQNNDTIVISNPDKKDLIFKTIDGNNGTNTIDIKDASIIIFNEKGDNILRFTNKQGESIHNDIKISNIYNLKTNSVTGNRFYGVYNSSMKFDVVGVNDNNVSNLLSYRNVAGVKINFNTCEVYKGNTKSVDKFSGINHFEGSVALVNTFFIAKVLGSPSSLDSNAAIKTIYINSDPKNPEDKGQNKDIIDISKAGDDAVLHVVAQQLDGSEIQYKWNNIGVFSLTNNQTIYVAFDENFKYKWVYKSETDNISQNAVLVFSNKEGKGGKEYKDGYAIIDTTLGMAQTYDESNKELADITFNNISVIKGTGNIKDVFYASINNIEYYSSNIVKKGIFYKINEKDGTYGAGTLSYQKFLTEYGMNFVFNADNSAVITEAGKEASKKLDKAYGIRTYIGSMKDDTFVIAKNKGSGKVIIDGYGGSFNSIDFSQTAGGDKGIELDTTVGMSLGDFDYVFKNISTFKLTNNSDTVLGSLDNKGFLNKDSKELSADIVIDANGGTDNTIDYTKYLKGTNDNIIKVNADLNIATITKEGKNSEGKYLNSNDIIAVNGYIKFQKIFLNGEYVSNILTISSRNEDNKVYVEVKNPTDDLIQLINFELVEQKLDIIWDGQNIDNKNTNVLLTSLNGKHISYVGFNSFILSKQDSTLTIKKNANLITSGGKLNGGGGRNTLTIDNDNKNSSIVINSNRETISLNLNGEKESQYSIINFQAFYLGCMSNKFLVKDSSYYTITFTNKEAYNEVSFAELVTSYIVLDFTQITNDGANLVVSKESISDGKLNGKDTIYNVRNLILTNNDDTVELFDTEKIDNKITIDGGGGINTISFKKWDKEVDLSKITDKGNIEIGNYILKNFVNIILRDKNDEITLNELSNLTVDGGGGENKVTYTGNFNVGDQIGGVSVLEFTSMKPSGAVINGTRIAKNGGKVDNLLRFNYFILPNNCNNTYIAQFVDIKENNPKHYTIDFNWTERNDDKFNNIMDYTKLSGAKEGIYAIFDSSKINQLIVDVFRDISKKSTATCIQDRLLNVGVINSSTQGGDIFDIAGIYNTYCTINAIGKKESTINFLSENSKREKDNTTIWNLLDNIKSVINTSQESYYLKFKGNIKNILVHSTPKNSKVLDQEFIINNFKDSYNIIYKIEGTVSNDVTYASLNLSQLEITNQLRINITQIANKGDVQLSKVVASGNQGALTIFGVDHIVGSKKAQNVFAIEHEEASNYPDRYIYLIGNDNYGGDYIHITGGNFLKVMKMYADDERGGIRLSTESSKQANYLLKNIRHFSLKNVSEFVFNITNSKIYNANYKFEVKEGNSNFYIHIDKTVTDLKSILDGSNLYFSSNSVGLSFVSDKIDNIIMEDGGKGAYIMIKSRPDKEYTFNIFSILDFSELIGDFKCVVSNNSDQWEIRESKLKFTGTPNMMPEVYMPKSDALSLEFNLDYKYTQTLFNNINIYATKYINPLTLTVNSGDVLHSDISIKDSLISFMHQSGSRNTTQRGNISIHNYKGSSLSINYMAPVNCNLEVNLSSFLHVNTHLDYTKGTSFIKSFNINAVSLPVGDIHLQVSRITLSPKLILDVGDIVKRNSDITMTIPNDSVIEFDKNFFYDYINNLKDNGATGKYHIKAQKPSDTDPTLFVKIMGENSYKPLPESFQMHIILDFNKNGVLNFILDKVRIDDKFYNTQFVLYGVVMPNPCLQTGFCNSTNTIYKITNATGELHLGVPTDSKKYTSEVVYGGADGGYVNLNIGDIFYILSLTSGAGKVNKHTLTTQNILRFSFQKITNYKSFSFNIEKFSENIASKSEAIIVHAPDFAKKDAQIKQPRDLEVFVDNSFTINLMNLSSKKDINLNIVDKTVSVNIGTQDVMFLSNLTRLNCYSRFPVNVNMDYKSTWEQSFVLNVSVAENSINTLTYENVNGIISYEKGAVKKGNSKDALIYDVIGGFHKVNFVKNLLCNLFITANKSPLASVAEYSEITQNIVIDGEGLTKVFVNLEEIGSSYNNTVIHINDIKNLHFTFDKSSNYNVYFVQNNEYYDSNNKICHLNTNGYFVIFDSATNMKVYFTGTGIEKFGKVFELLSKQYIKVVSNYQELMDVIDNPGRRTDILLNETLWDLDQEDITISYENTNHSSSVSFIDEDDDKAADKNSEDFYTLYQEMQHEEQNNEFYTNVVSNINQNNTEDLNILSEDVNSNNTLSVEIEDVLEFTSKDIDNIFANSTNNFLENENDYTINGEEVTSYNPDDSDYLLDIIEEISSLESINTECCKDNAILISESTIDNDPSAKVEDSMNKQNTINGNNFK